MSGKLAGKVALVTGAGSGLGRAIALRFAAEGARVAVNDIAAASAEETVAQLAGEGLAIPADVADSAAVAAMFERVDGNFGRLDVLVNNAGIGEASGGELERLNQTFERRVMEGLGAGVVTTPWEVTERMTDQVWRRMMAVHLDGTFFCARSAIPRLVRAGGGSIINMSSIAGLGGLEAAPHYSAAKAGIVGFTKSIARELGSQKIRVNAICPGFIDTPMTQPFSPLFRKAIVGQTPLGRWGEPDEIAALALFLASDDAAFFTGQALSPNGGLYV